MKNIYRMEPISCTSYPLCEILLNTMRTQLLYNTSLQAVNATVKGEDVVLSSVVRFEVFTAVTMKNGVFLYYAVWPF
jgi:hypothetical protein